MQNLRITLLAVVLLATLGLAGACSDTKDEMSGGEVAKVANKQLEKENPEIAHGELTCKALVVKVDAKTRCVRTVAGTAGRLVKIGVGVQVTSIKDTTAHLGIKVDQEPQEFGLTGEFIEDDLAKQYQTRFGSAPDEVDCPYLQGAMGNQITCELTAEGEDHDVEVTVSAVDAANLDTDYTYRAPTLDD